MFELGIAIIFCVGYAMIAAERYVRVNKAAVALVTAVVCWVLMAGRAAMGQVEPIAGVVEMFGHHLAEVAQIIFFLIGAMTIVEIMETHGGFRVVTEAIKTRDRRMLLWTVSWLTFFLAAVLGLLPTAIVMVSLLSRLVDNREDRLIFSSMIIIAANAGGAWSPIGDVTTTMLWIGGQVSAFGLVKKMLLPSAVCVLVPLVWFSCSMKGGVVAAVKRPAEAAAFGAKRIFWLGLGALLFVPVFKILTGLPPVVGMLLGLGVMWLVTDFIHDDTREHLKAPSALSRIDFSSILFFLGILLAVAALESAGLLRDLAVWLDRYFGNKDIIATLLGLLSAIVDNVPLTAATMGMYSLAQCPTDSKLWEFLAYAVGTGGSILIIGSAAGVVVMGMEKIEFFWYLRKVSLPALAGYLAGIGVYLFLYQLMH